MSATKILVIVLLLFAALFVGVVVYGVGKNASVKTTGNSKQDAKNFKIEEYHGVEILSRLLKPRFACIILPAVFCFTYAPKLEPEQMKQGLRIFDRGSHPQFNLQFQPITIQIFPDNDHKFRKATFVVTPADCAIIEYKAEGDVDPNLKEQKWPSEESQKRDKTTFWILKTIGTVTLSRKFLPGPCTVALE